MNGYIKRAILRKMKAKEDERIENEQIEIEAALALESITEESSDEIVYLGLSSLFQLLASVLTQ